MTNENSNLILLANNQQLNEEDIRNLCDYTTKLMRYVLLSSLSF